MRSSAFLIAVLTASSFHSLSAQSTTLERRLDSLFATVDSATTPGCAVGVSRAVGSPLFRSYGLANLEQPTPIDSVTVFEAGSVSKQITAAAMLLLAKEGRLSLNDPARKWLPELWPGLPSFTLGDMLHHVAGLRDYGDLMELSGWPRGTRVYDSTDVLRVLSLQRALNFTPRAEYAYSNSGYALAAIVVARASGMSFGAYTRRAIFEPLGMVHSSWRDDFTRIVARRAQGYTPNDSGRWTIDMPFENTVGHGGLLTTASDLMRWQRRFAPGADTTMGGSDFARNMEAQITLSTGRVSGYALGLEIDVLAGERTVSHGGWTAGYKSYVGRVPTRGVAVALLCNAGALNTEEVGAALLAIAADAPVAAYYSEPQIGVAADTLSPQSLARLAGTYRSARTRQSVRVRAYTDGITVNSWTGYRRLSDKLFASLDGARRMEFAFDGRGRAIAYQVSQLADTVRYTRVEAWTPSSSELSGLVGRYRCGEADTDVALVPDGQGLALLRRGRLRSALSPRYRDAFDVSDLGWLLTVRRDVRGQVIAVDFGGSRSRTVPCNRALR